MRSQLPIPISSWANILLHLPPPHTTPSHRRGELAPAAEERYALVAASDSGSGSSRLPPSLGWGFVTAITNETANQALMREIRNVRQEGNGGGIAMKWTLFSPRCRRRRRRDGALHRRRRQWGRPAEQS